MTIEYLLAFNIALIVAIASPGPALLLAIQTTLSAGRRAGIAIGFGLGLMASIWTLMALLGLEAAFQIFPLAYTVVKIAGAVYLLYLAWKMWGGARKNIETRMIPAKQSFRQGFTINALNPKSMLFAAAVLIVIFPTGMTLFENSIVVLNHFIVEVVFYTAIAFGMNTPTMSNQYMKARVYIDRTAAVILGGLGVRLLVNQ